MLHRLDTEGDNLALEYYNVYNYAKSILEDERIKIGIRRLFLTLLDDRELFLDNHYGIAIYSTLRDVSYNAAKVIYLMHKNKRIRNNPLCIEFIDDENNLNLLQSAYLVFSSEALETQDLKNLLEIESIKKRREYLESLMSKYYNKKASKPEKKAIARVIKEDFESYLDGDLSLSSFESSASLLRKKEFNNLRIDF